MRRLRRLAAYPLEVMLLRLEGDGRLALPAEACAALGWQPGDLIEAAVDGAELRLRRAPDQLAGLRASLVGALVDWGVPEAGAREAAAYLPDPAPAFMAPPE